MGLFDIFKPSHRIDQQIFNVVDDDFELQVLQRSFKTPVLADFWADWCGPCRQLSPVLERIALSADAPFRLAKIRTDDAPIASNKYKIKSIPAVKLFRNGIVVGQFQGLQLEHNIRRFAAETLAKDAPQIRLRIEAGANRIAHAQQAIKQGDGFRATLLLRDLDDDQAKQLLPLAQFMWDATDGDILTGNRKVDGMYLDAADAIEDGQIEDAERWLKTIQAKVNGEADARVTAILTGLAQL